VKLAVMKLLYEKYGFVEDDLISAELEAVPAFNATDIGLDASMIGAYGHDDRVCGYAALKALLDLETAPAKTGICLLADKEEVGSTGVSGMATAAFDTFMEDLCESQNVPVRVCYEHSFCLSADVTAAYETWLRETGVCKNTSSFYMRILRAAYNRAVEKGLALQTYPFRHVYTGIDKTVKRAIPLEAIRRIRNMELTGSPALGFARDMFLFSFYTRGMSFVDMAFLRRSDLKAGMLTYRRQKTGQPLAIRWEPCMQEIVDRHPNAGTEYLLPIIRTPGNEHAQYKNIGYRINCGLKALGRQIGLEAPLTLYVARHTWASIARSKEIPLSVISESMGHNSEATTRIYLASLDTATVDRANRLVIDALAGLE